MKKELLNKIIEKYKEAEDQITKLDNEFGVCLWNSYNENFYNKYNYIIFKLFEEIYTPEKRELLEEYIFEQIDQMTFDELYEYLENN